MSVIDQKYTEALKTFSGKDKVERTFSLFSSICEMLTLQLAKESPTLSERELRIKVAQRLYLSDNQTQNLISKAALL